MFQVTRHRPIGNILKTSSFCILNYTNARNFSFYENYSETCKDYDKSRRALGIDIFDNGLKSMYENNYQPRNKYFVTKPNGYCYSRFKSDLYVLDGGCGTGLYTKAVADLGVGHITGLELNEGMLGKCREKLVSTQQQKLANKSKNALEQSVRLFQGNLIEMPFKSSAFDAMMINMVLHHLDDIDTRKQDLLNVKKVFSRCHDVLSDDGMLFITTSTPLQMQFGLWYYQFFPEATRVMLEKFRAEDWWQKYILEAGFSKVEIIKIEDSNMNFGDYVNFKGIFDQEWRNGDSLFALVSEQELKSGLKKIKTIVDNEHDLQIFYQQSEQRRLEYGHAIAIIAHK